MKIKDIAIVGVFTALLIGGQLALSYVPGVEIVTVLLLSFSFSFGPVRGVSAATLFSLLRCLLFGFYPTVIILYLVYYNLFALFFGVFGRIVKRRTDVKVLVMTVIFAAIFTALFTLLDDLITPLFYHFSTVATKAYFFASLEFMIPQIICAVISSTILFIPLAGIMKKAFRL